MFNQLFALFSSIIPLSDDLKACLNDQLEVQEIAKKSFLLKEGQVCNHIYFIEKGLVRSYYVKDGVEICSWFMKEGDVIISVNSFFKRVPSLENIQCLEDSVVYGITYEALQLLYKRFIEFNIIGRILTEKYYMLSEERLYSMRKQSAKESYLYLLENHPTLLQRVPRKHVASYLGISLETLSRMKFKKKN